MNSNAMITSTFLVQPSQLLARSSVVVQPSWLHEEAGVTPAPQ
jgi:hypothetical protein